MNRTLAEWSLEMPAWLGNAFLSEVEAQQRGERTADSLSGAIDSITWDQTSSEMFWSDVNNHYEYGDEDPEEYPMPEIDELLGPTHLTMRPIPELLALLPPGYRELALAAHAHNPLATQASSVARAIMTGWSWTGSPQRHRWWQLVYQAYRDDELIQDLPPLPEGTAVAQTTTLVQTPETILNDEQFALLCPLFEHLELFYSQQINATRMKEFLRDNMEQIHSATRSGFVHRYSAHVRTAMRTAGPGVIVHF